MQSGQVWNKWAFHSALDQLDHQLWILVPALDRAILTVIFTVLWLIIMKYYKREDVLPNEHIYAERYL